VNPSSGSYERTQRELEILRILAQGEVDIERGVGYDLDSVMAEVDDDMLIELEARSDDEPRSLVVGVIGGRHYSAVVTYREGRIRLISVRRARDSEVALYEGK